MKELQRKFHKVLDCGFVSLVDYLGGDSCVVQAARVSYGKGTKSVSSDDALIRYLMRHNHMTPFEMPVLRFHIKCPIFVARQWFRHRMGSFNEISGRYSEMKDEYYTPTHFRAQSKDNKQGSSNKVIDLDMGYDSVCMESFGEYQVLLDKGVSREQARMCLPLSTYTEFYWQVNLRSLFNFLSLRTDSHAQYEIRAYAAVIERIVESLYNSSYKAYKMYHKNSITFTIDELACIEKIFCPTEPRGFIIDKNKAKKLLTSRERVELEDKLESVVRRLQHAEDIQDS